MSDSPNTPGSPAPESAPQAPVPPAAPVPQPSAPRSSRTSVLVGAIVLGVVALGGVALAYSANLIPLPFFGSEPYNREQVLTGLAVGFSKIDRSSFDVGLQVVTEPRDEDAKPIELDEDTGEELAMLANYIPADFDLTLRFAGAAESDTEDTDFQATFEGALKSSDLSAEASVDFKRVAGDMYFLVNKFPALFVDVAALKGKWVKVTAADMEEYGISFSELGDFNLEKQDELREKQIQVVRLADKHNVLALKGDPNRESFEGDTMYHYTLAFNAGELKSFLEDVAAVYDTDTSELEELFEVIDSDMGQSFIDYLEDNITYEVWADSQGVPHKLRMSVRLVPSDDIVRMQDKQVRLNIELVLRDINEDVSIEAPETTMSFEEAQELLFGSTMTSSRASARDARRVADLKNLQVGLELYYNDVGRYPSALSALAVSYLANVPVDPADSLPYYYDVSVNGQGYELGTDLEEQGSHLLKRDDDEAQPSGMLKSSADFKSCSGKSGRYCYDIEL
jgi:hypothetical protein